MPLIKDLRAEKFLKFDTEAYRTFSKNARLVYLAFLDTHPNVNPTDKYMAKKVGVSKSTYKVAKKVLIDNGYLVVHRTGFKNGIINYHFGRFAVKAYYDNLDGSSKL